MAFLSVTFASGESSLSVTRFSVRESMSRPFSISIWARSPDPGIDLGGIIGQAAAFTIGSGYAYAAVQARSWTGVCSHAELVHATTAGLSTYHFELVPTLWLLEKRRNYRIFQHTSLPDIATKLLKEWGIAPTLHIDAGAYPKLEFKVQYGETDESFLHRLLEEAGISYLFEEAGGKSTLVFDDEPEKGSPRGGPPLPYVDNPNEAAELEYVTELLVSAEVRPGSYTYRDHDFRRPAYPLFGEAPRSPAPEDRYEQYRYDPGAFLVETGKGGGTPVADDQGIARNDEAYGKARAARSLVAERLHRRAVQLSTNAFDLRPGTVFSIDGHPHPEVDGKGLLVTDLSIDGTPEGAWQGRVHAVVASDPYRPAIVTPKPRIRSTQVATVVGPRGQEIHTDEFGRVRVQFPWDREGKFDEKSSCWMRVSEGWAGAGYGMIHLPRIGDEVLVSFLDGDPDCPVVTGRLHNPERPPPYPLPVSARVSAWKSDSSIGSNGHNAITLDDTKGGEVFTLQAEKNLRHLVKANETLTVGTNRNKEVKANETDATGVSRVQTAGADRTEATLKDRVTFVGGDRDKLVHGDEQKRAEADLLTCLVKEEHKKIVRSQKELVEGSCHLTVRGSSMELTDNILSISVGGKHHEKMGKGYGFGADEKIYFKAGTAAVGEAMDVTFAGPGGFVRIDASGVVVVGKTVKINCSGGEAGSGDAPKPVAPVPPREAALPDPSLLKLLPVPLDKTRLPSERAMLEGATGKNAFPTLGTDFEIVAPSTRSYNCIAHTLNDHTRWVNPETGPKSNPLSEMDKKYSALGYTRSSGMDYSVEPGKDKVVVYATKNPDGSIKDVTHGALQTSDGAWTSKLGQGPLIKHPTPEALNGPVYGEPVAVYEKGP